MVRALLLGMIGLEVWLSLFLAVLGLGLVVVGIVARVRAPRMPDGHSPAARTAVLLVLAGIFLLGFTGLVIYEKWWPFFVQIARTDQVDTGELAQLKTARLYGDDAPPGAGADWPQWRGPRRDGVSPETGLRTDWTKQPPRTVWKQPLGLGYSSIAVAGGRLYTMDRPRQKDEERVVCLDAATGKEVWVHRYPVAYQGFQSHATCPRATPTVHDGRVYTVGATGVFLCLEARPKDGKAHVLWQHDLLQEFNAEMPRWGVACSPLVEGDLVCVQPGGSKGSVAAFDRRTGAVVWKALADISGYSSPVAATAAGVRQIICFTGRRLAGLRPSDGGQLWDFAWITPYDANIATPIVAGDYVFISTDYGTGCALLHLVAQEGGGVGATPVYVKTNKLMRNKHASCVLHDGFLYGSDVGTGELRCVDLRTAEEKWSAHNVSNSCVLYVDGHLLVLTQDGTLWLVEATPQKFQKKGQIEVLDGPECWALPALAGGRLYLRDHQELVCLDLKK